MSEILARRLTKAQMSLLGRVRAASVLRLNGRARRPVLALARAGYVTYSFDLRPSGMGKWTEVFVVRPTEKEGP